jgi:hypothetical protein
VHEWVVGAAAPALLTRNLFAQNARTHLRAIPKLVESTNMWWEDEKKEKEEMAARTEGGDGARSHIASRIERLRRVAKGEKVSARRASRGGGGGSNMSLPELKMRMGGGGGLKERLFEDAGGDDMSSSQEGSSWGGGGRGAWGGGYNDGESIDSSLGLGSIDESSVGGAGSLDGSLSSESGAGSSYVGSIRSMPTAKTRFMMVKGSEDAESVNERRKMIKKKYGGGKQRDLVRVKRGLNIVGGKVVVDVR